MQMLTKGLPDFSDIVDFGSPCTVHIDARNKSLGERGKHGIIIVKSDERKGYRVYMPKEKIFIVMQHVQNVETLTEEQNAQLHHVHLTEDDEAIGYNGGYPLIKIPIPVPGGK